MLNVVLLALSIAAPTRDTVSPQAIEAEISALVRISPVVVGPNGRDSARFVGFAIDSVPSGSLLGSFLHADGKLVWYLAVHTPGAEARLVSTRDNPRAVRDSIVSALQTNAVFKGHLFLMLSKYWHQDGRVIAGYVPPAQLPSVSATQLSRIGARFFYPDRMSATGDTLYSHICAGVNGLGDLPEPVDPLVEAFVFVAVNDVVFEPKSPLMDAFDVASKRAKATSVSKDPATRVLRAQGALWSQLEESPALARALTTAYARHERSLPFRMTLAGNRPMAVAGLD
jgi:hypothetical protein